MRHDRDIFSIFFKMKLCCVFSLESPHQAILMSKHDNPFSISKGKSPEIIPNTFIIIIIILFAAMEFCFIRDS